MSMTRRWPPRARWWTGQSRWFSACALRPDVGSLVSGFHPRAGGRRCWRQATSVVEFRIADTFTDSLARLTNDEQKAVKTTAFDLQVDPSSPGMQFHAIDRLKDKRFWSVRVSQDIRLIVHRLPDSLMLCYVD